jgi:putative hydrolase of the HAD superfamily
VALGSLITLDALGTLVGLEPPAPRLAAALAARGIATTERQAGAAMAAEIAFYRAHLHTAGDAAGLQRLRARCADVLREVLAGAGVPGVQGLAAGELQEILLGALRFAAYDEVPAALAALRDAGHRLVVVSNWDVSLHEVLRTTGLRELVDGAISSAEAGVAKPDPAIFERARAIAGGGGGLAPGGLHAGDSVGHDVAGALAAGLDAVLVVRAGRAPAVPAGVRVVGSLAELPALVRNL